MDNIVRIKDWVVYTEPGKKSKFDFKVKYRKGIKRVRTPKHIHLIVDLYMKYARNRELTLKFVKYLLNILDRIKRVEEYPPKLQIYDSVEYNEFLELDKYGEYPIQFILAVFELIMLQEKINYPKGVMNRKLFEKFLNEADIFSVVSAATFR